MNQISVYQRQFGTLIFGNTLIFGKFTFLFSLMKILENITEYYYRILQNTITEYLRNKCSAYTCQKSQVILHIRTRKDLRQTTISK